MALDSGRPFDRRLSQFEVEERGLDTRYEWLVSGRKLRQGRLILPEGLEDLAGQGAS